MRYAPMDGFAPDAERPGFYADPTRQGWLRTADGQWWSRMDVDTGRLEMTPEGPRTRLLVARLEELRLALEGVAP